MRSRRYVTRDRARRLRREATLAERLLWSQLRGKQIQGHRFRRQHPIGPYIVDFACTRFRLAVEVDGAQHDERRKLDDRRTRELSRMGWRVLRFWNDEVLVDMDAVLGRVLAACEERL